MINDLEKFFKTSTNSKKTVICKQILTMKNLLTIFLLAFTFPLSAQEINTIPYTEKVLPAKKLSSNVNSIYAERLPIITPDGRTLYFARKYHPDNTPDKREKNTYEIYKDDIWVSRRQTGSDWSKARNIGAPLNTDSHNFVIAVSADGKTLYLANKYKTQKDGVSYSEKTAMGWSKPKAFDIPNMYNRSKFVGYHVNVKGDVLIMAVERSKTQGGRDLYVSFRKKGDNWTEPKNMGKVINSKSEEASVFIAADNKTIYFSSMGHPGYGGYDVFMSRRLDDTWTKWSEPLNLGERINTRGNDYNYTVPASGEYAYFSSDVGEKSLMSNLYKIELPREVRPKPVTVINFTMKKKPEKKKDKPIEVNITMKRKSRDIESTTAVRPNKTKKIDKRKNKKELAPTPEIEEQVVMIIDDETEDELPEIPGYFTVREAPKTEVVYEEIDYDGDDPEIIEEIKIPNKVKRMKRRDAKKDSPELETMKQKLLSLEYEIEEITEERNDENLTEKKPEKVTIKYRRKVEDDPRMLLLKRKYAGMHKSVDEIEDDPQLALMKNKFKNLYYTDDEEDEEESIAEIRLKRQRERESAPKRETRKSELETRNPKPKKSKSTYRPDNTNDDEIANVMEDEETMTETPSFEELQAKVREDVERDLVEEVRLELQQELIGEVRSELENELLREVRTQLEDDLRDDIEQQLRNELEESVAQRLEEDLEENVKDDLRSEMRDDIEKELRETMRNDIEKSLREQLADEIKDELREELSFRYKKEIETQLRREITQKVRKESKERERDIAQNAPETAEPKAYRELAESVTLYPIEVGQIIPLDNIYFDANEATLKVESEAELLRALKFLDQNPNLVVEISGHTNGLCSTEFANELSNARSATVANFLRENGVNKIRVTNKGYGKINPIASNANAAGRRKNQRVEMKILRINE